MTQDTLTFLEELFKIARIHADRLSASSERFHAALPLSSHDVETFTFDDLAAMDMFITRFSKLQDLMGAKIFKAVIDYAGKSTEPMTLIDRLHTLEKFGVIDNAALWKEMRDMRNHLAHEYPNAPDITANYLNQALEMTPDLLKTLDRLEAFVETLRVKNATL